MSRPERVAPLFIALAATLASAHGLDALEGTALVRSDRVEIGIEVDGAAQDVVQDLALHDETGRSLSGRVESVLPGSSPGHLMFRVRYPLDRPQRWLSFRMAPGEWAAARARRLVLTVRAEDDPRPRLITLTNGGNVETLRFAAPAPASECGPAFLDAGPDRPGEVLALWRPGEGEARLVLVVPLGVLETWLTVPRADPEALDPAEQDAARASVLALVTGSMRVEGAVAPVAGEVAFLGLDDSAADPVKAHRLDAWTARVRVSLRFDRAGRLAWDLWNARVTTARVVVLDANGCAEHRLSTYDPAL